MIFCRNYQRHIPDNIKLSFNFFALKKKKIMNPNQLVSDLVSSLLDGNESPELEQLISVRIDECCVVDKFYTLPYESISRILDLSKENLTQEIVCTILTKLVENKRSQQACLLLMNIEVSKATLGQCCAMLGCISPAPLCKLLLENWNIAKAKIYTLYDDLDNAKADLEQAQNNLHAAQAELVNKQNEIDILRQEIISQRKSAADYLHAITVKDQELERRNAELNQKDIEIQQLSDKLKELIPQQNQNQVTFSKKQEETMKRVSSIPSLTDIVEKPLKFIEKFDEAVKAGDLTSVRYHIKNGADIEQRDAFVPFPIFFLIFN